MTHDNDKCTITHEYVCLIKLSLHRLVQPLTLDELVSPIALPPSNHTPADGRMQLLKIFLVDKVILMIMQIMEQFPAGDPLWKLVFHLAFFTLFKCLLFLMMIVQQPTNKLGSQLVTQWFVPAKQEKMHVRFTIITLIELYGQAGL